MITTQNNNELQNKTETLSEKITHHFQEKMHETVEMVKHPKQFFKNIYEEAKKEGPAFAAYAVAVEVTEDVIAPAILSAVGKPEYIPILWAIHTEPVMYPLYFAARKAYRSLHGTKEVNETIDSNVEKNYAFIPQRTQPPHIGHISMLESACSKYDHVTIGIGSANKTNSMNPYTAQERELMLNKSLEDKGVSNYSFVHLNDYESDDEWFSNVKENANICKNTTIISGNDWVNGVFENEGYQTKTPQEIVPFELYKISGTKLREMIVDDNPEWKEYAATGTTHYFEQFGGRDRLLANETNQFAA